MLTSALGLHDDESPFPWQEDLLKRLRVCKSHRLSLDVPTGLGKTSVMSAWLVALADGAKLPRRLVYIVDRRAVVDQATREAERLRIWLEQNSNVKESLGIATNAKLPISTLRGQFADNREWLADPTSPAIIVGTVDMVGSRLLFEGYGVSRKMRPYHAGFLGADALFVLDEAHLVRPFEELLKTVTGDSFALQGAKSATELIPRTMLLSLSATGRTDDGDVIQISHKDIDHPVAGKRLKAEKHLIFVPAPKESKPIHERLAEEAWTLSDEGTKAVRIIVFSNSRETAQKTSDALLKLAKAAKQKNTPTELFVGARRVRERQRVERWLEDHGFLAGSQSPCEKAAFVFATSAGEVGVDLDADHMVGDLVAFERMVQRFGRVNRRGNGNAEIRILLECEEPDEKETKTLAKALAKPSRERNSGEHNAVRQFDLAVKYRQVLEQLPSKNDDIDASPEAFRQLKAAAAKDDSLRTLVEEATSPNPLRPELTRPILDSWAMTSLETHAARPNVAPWLRGWVDDEPQTTIVWRRHLPTVSANCSDTRIRQFFENAPIHLTEKLETTSGIASNWLLKRVEQLHKQLRNADPDLVERLPKSKDIVVIILGNGGEVIRKLGFGELQFTGGKKFQNDKRTFERQVQNHTLVIDSRMGGLDSGLLTDDAKNTQPTEAIDARPPSEWIESTSTDQDVEPIPGFRVTLTDNDDVNVPLDDNYKVCFRLPIQNQDEGESSEDEPSHILTVWKYKKTATSEDSRSTIGLQRLEDHHRHAEDIAAEFAERLNLPDDLTQALRIAARNHDHGKNCELWQDAFSAPDDHGRPYAKTNGPLRVKHLHGYRHEFGSLPHLENDPEFSSLSPELQDLALHLVAAHHGFARPVIRIDGCSNGPPSVLEDRARDVALRFAGLQKHWGPWGLAWLESLLRATDHRASGLVEDSTALNSSEEAIYG